jgi:putative glycosyl hydrolase-like family 15 (GHL15) protein
MIERRLAIVGSLFCVMLLLGVASGVSAADAAAAPGAPPVPVPAFPRLLGMNIGAKNYDDPAYQRELARLDVVILGFYRGWTPPGDTGSSAAGIRRTIRAIKALNPLVRIGQYTVLNEASTDVNDKATADLRAKLNASRWWLVNALGRQVQWTSDFGTWEINFTQWTAPDADGRRWPEWLAERNYATFFRDIPEFDVVYIDNVMSVPRVKGDWNGDGVDDDPKSPQIVAAYRSGQRAYWRALRALLPNALLIGNTDNDLDDPAWRGELDGAFLEAMMGERWSLERRLGWQAMMERYRRVMRNTREPRIVGFNAVGSATDYRFFRYAYTSCLLDDGYFSFTDRARGHSSVPWFDEYEHKLGKALAEPPRAAWSGGIWRRDFERGVILVNPTTTTRTVVVEPGLRRLHGRQDASVNDGSPASRVAIAAKDGIVLLR